MRPATTFFDDPDVNLTANCLPLVTGQFIFEKPPRDEFTDIEPTAVRFTDPPSCS